MRDEEADEAIAVIGEAMSVLDGAVE
jgi:hypothetical protein